jgi:hypothetical protein
MYKLNYDWAIYLKTNTAMGNIITHFFLTVSLWSTLSEMKEAGYFLMHDKAAK